LTTFSIFPFLKSSINDTRIDRRIKPYLTHWRVIETYKGKTHSIPPIWNSSCDVVKYFQVIKSDNSDNPGEAENEIGATIWLGWTGYDHQIEINLFITGKDVLSGDCKVSAEILKASGSPSKLYHNNKFITDFKKKEWWNITKLDKVWINL